MTDTATLPAGALPQGATIGILGGGQLGRMLSVSASRLGFKTCIFEPAGDCPASHVANYHFKAAYDDADALLNFARSVDVVSYEFENIPTAALDLIQDHSIIRPGRAALSTSQDRLTEKNFLSGLGLRTAPYADITNLASLTKALETFGMPAILKTRRFGYDGKGQVRINDISEAAAALEAVQGAPCVLEGFVPFSCEISVIAARSPSGEVVCYDPGENVHSDGILRTTTVPSTVPAPQRMDAVLMAAKILNALEYVGVMGLELFMTSTGLVVNEIAPRVHNSGHWTQNGCTTCQFEQHIRAIAGWSLGDGTRHSDVRMENLIGNDMDRLPALLSSNAAVHLYGKADVKKGRKMGHVNFITP